jgi:hypothetical protein
MVERFPRFPTLLEKPDEGSQAVAITSDRVDLDHGLLMRRGPSSRHRRHRGKRGATILSTMALGARAVTAVASQVEHTDVDPDVRLLLLSQSGRYKRQGAEWRFLPTVVFQEFSNEERCRAAKSTLEGSLKEAGAKLKSGLEDLNTIGKADPAQIIIAFNVECLPK